MKQAKPIVLIVLDGWGYREEPEFNAIAAASTPNWDHYWSLYPHALISGSGCDVGLPDGQMGNSEVGHLHMGAGRLVPQDLMRLDNAIKSGEFDQNEVLLAAIAKVKHCQSKLHIVGLLSPGGVHSHENHIRAMIRLAAEQGLTNINVHAILDGRDTPPRSALNSIALIEKEFKALNTGRLASIIGRYYAMDRDQRWDRVKKAYDLYTLGDAVCHVETAALGLELAYERNESDEFVQATAIHSPDERPVIIDDNDVVIFMNFRADRARQLTRAFIQTNFNQFERTKVPKLTAFVSLTEYATDIPSTIAYPPLSVKNTLGEYVALQGMKQLRIAETEKYAHVTFFFNGGQEKLFEGEDRLLIPSPKIATYDLQPEMSAIELTDKLLTAIKSKEYDLIICNFANADMVGHSGNMVATIKAIETIDTCLGRIINVLQEMGGEAVITADHGNAELMFDPNTTQSHTAHTENPVPFLYIGRKATINACHGSLIDIAPTLLCLLNLSLPPEMRGKSLVKLMSKNPPDSLARIDPL